MNNTLITVIRDGKPYHIYENDLLLGDLVLIQTGDVIPADLKLIEARSVEIDEFELTGELLPVRKTIAEKDVFVYMGSRVICGSAKGIVIAKGNETEYGRIMAQSSVTEESPWSRTINRDQLVFLLLLIPAAWISIFQSRNRLETVLVFLLIGFFVILIQNDQLFEFISFNHGQILINRHNILIRDFNVIRDMDDVDIICFDKTGVLTTRNIEITKFYFDLPLVEIAARHPDFENGIPALIKTACSLCTDVTYFEKIDFANPIDHALLSFVQKTGLNLEEVQQKSRRIYEIPFSSENRYMCCGYEIENQTNWYFMKGDPDIVLNKCTHYYSKNGKKNKLSFNFQSSIKTKTNLISQNGDTVIALAVAEMESNLNQPAYSFLCLVQLENVVQEGAKEVVHKVIENGIRPLLLTGDKQQAAIKISRDFGIVTESPVALNGNVIEKMALDEVGRQSEYCSVFSSLMPSQKGIIIRQLQKRGHRVAMVGDGPNDGIALRVADVGISFQTNSSPIAMQYSSVLLNRLSDLMVLVNISTNTVKTTKKIKLLRSLVLLVLLFLVYFDIFQ
ncbi:MAG: cation-transporting P-type ATPase [Ignavibacteria bacterium]|nr:cation-transporting P-type ATPase [Ignavibacteria bacterium]